MTADVPTTTTTPTVDWTPGPLQDRIEYIGVLLAIWNEGTVGRRPANDAHIEIDRALRELRELRRQIDGEIRDELAEEVSGE